LRLTVVAWADPPFELSRCEVVPLANHQVAFRIDGVEQTRWHFGREYPRPFFFPFNGPSGNSLTRMGHPGAPNHDHHRSIWLAHNDVNGFNFWSDQTDARIRQTSWQCYSDGNQEGIMAATIGWFDDAGKQLMHQEIVAALIPHHHREHALELQLTMRPASGSEAVQLGKTNFGFLAVRVSKAISAHFGGGQLTNSEGQKGEERIFGKNARWMDYSGPVAVGTGAGRKTVTEGITYFDHPDNPRYPTPWHVREDGWMGASFNMHAEFSINHDRPLVLRYLLHGHRGAYDQARARAAHASFAKRPGFIVSESSKKHEQFSVQRVSN
jgi:hypothetical protein